MLILSWLPIDEKKVRTDPTCCRLELKYFDSESVWISAIQYDGHWQYYVW